MSDTVEKILAVLLCFGASLLFIIMAISARKKFGKIRSIYHPTSLALLAAFAFALWGVGFAFAFFT